jgi:hypothetical protein
MMLATAIALSAGQRDRAALVALDAGILLLGLLPPIAYIAVKVRRGELSHAHLLHREERTWVFLLGIASLSGSMALYRALDCPRAVVDAALVGVAGACGAAAINVAFKISVHAAVAAGCATVLAPTSAGASAAAAVLAVTAGLARIPLGHHTPAQVVAGWAYGGGSAVVLMRWLGVA